MAQCCFFANGQQHMGFPKHGTFVFRSEGGMRRGYMGHLTRIANTVVHNLEKGPVHTQISSLITGACVCEHVHSYSYVKESDYSTPPEYCFPNVVVLMVLDAELPEDYRGRWETFVDQTLSETNRKNTIDLVNLHPFLSTLYNSCFNHTHTHTHTHTYFKCDICGVFYLIQIGTGNPRPSSEDDMESPFPKELTLQQVRTHKHAHKNIEGFCSRRLKSNSNCDVCFRLSQTTRSSR